MNILNTNTIKNKRIKTSVYVAFTVVAVLIFDWSFFQRVETINIYNLILEFFMALVSLYLLLLIQKINKHTFYKFLNIGFYLFFLSYLVDALDQVFIHSFIYTVILEKTTLAFAAIFIVMGVHQWIEIYRNSSLTDDLTQIPNRKSIRRKILKAIDNYQNQAGNLHVVIIDIDHFKKVNDQYGHICGDKALLTIAQTIYNSIEDNDKVGRWGGEEFVLMVKNCNKKQILEKMNKLRLRISDQFSICKQSKVLLSASMGISQWGIKDDSFEAFISRADDALYLAKNSGRNNVKF